jgi:hypothetical protein
MGEEGEVVDNYEKVSIEYKSMFKGYFVVFVGKVEEKA